MTTPEEIAELFNPPSLNEVECDPLILRLLECHERYQRGMFSFGKPTTQLGWVIYWNGRAMPWALNLRLGFGGDKVAYYETVVQAMLVTESPRLLEIIEEVGG